MKTNKQTNKQTKHNSLLFLVFIFISLLFGCSEEEAKIIQSNNGVDSESLIIGEKKENPYSIANMQKALEYLKSSNELKSDIPIKTTHFYLRFLPKNTEEYNLLIEDTTVDFFPYPLDYSYENTGSRYKDPNLADSCIPYQYCAWKIDKQLPPIDFEILDTLYLSENIFSDLKSDDDYSILENTSLMLTNNLSKLKGSDWRPKGNIKLKESNPIGTKPVKGAKIRIYSWFKVRDAFTDDYGNFSSPSTFSNDVNYEIKWERDMWDIRDGSWGQAYFKGPEKVGDWNEIIDTEEHNVFFATVHRAAFEYQYRNSEVPKFPKVDIGVYFQVGESSGKAGPFNNLITGPEILIFTQQLSFGEIKNYDTYLVFTTTCHELGHAAHWNFMNDYTYATKVDIKLIEGWSTAIEYYFLKKEYKDIPDSYFSKQTYKKGGDKYSPIIIDLIDDYNQFVTGKNYQNDKICCYTYNEIKECLKTALTLDQFKQNLKNKYDYPSREVLLDEYFQFYK